MTVRDLDVSLLDRLRREARAEDLELFLKRGRTRRLVREGERQLQAEADEQGWAVRATTGRGSFFACGTGEPAPGAPWPEPDGQPLTLPPPADPGEWREPPQAPLASESEMRALALSVDKELEQALPGARLELLLLEDGQSESRIANTHGVRCGWRTRLASLAVEAVDGAAGQGAGGQGAPARVEWVRSDLRDMSPRRVTTRLADLLTIARQGRPVARDRCEVIVAPEVAVRLLAGLLPLFDPATSEPLVAGLGGARGLANPAVTLIDDGRLPGGVLASPVDGEGTPTRPVALIEAGAFRQPLLPWWAARAGGRSGGCSRRDSWREQPRIGPSHLFLQPDPGVRAADLVGALSRGYYLLDAVGPARFRFADDRFSLGVRGFELLGGRARSPVAGIRLAGSIRALLQGVRAVARDLTLIRLPVGLIGSPTLRLQGLELLGGDGS